ncbi:linker for activation of T-cells family member 2 [Perognathus longimembris pacificus]|uniref:linker for activation of T-cells family member 2 n=1 Tax=Perognathus longimembris pacificus TaxID=214514 RepID=UPI002019576D|nr:linker for activation of T-cells family member 2 [Perognathus longimembris pacificus]
MGWANCLPLLPHRMGLPSDLGRVFLSRNLVAVDDYNWGCLQKSWEGGSGDGGSSDGNSYENVLVCQPGPPTAGGSRMGTQAGEGSGSRPSSLCPADGEESDYQNCTSIHRWRESVRGVGQAWGAPPGTPAGSPGDHEEPDYVNA